MITEINEYLQGLEQGEYSPATVRNYSKDISKLSSYFNITHVSQFETITVSQFLEFYKAQGLSANSTRALIMNLSAFFNWLMKGRISKSEFFNVTFGNNKYPKVIREKKMILSQEETDELIKAGANFQERFMLALMCMTAIRRGEVVKIKLSDIQGCKIIINGKGGNQRKIFLDEVLCTMLSLYMAERESNSPYLFFGERGSKDEIEGMSTQSVYNRVKSAGLRAGISQEKLDKLTPHRLRGTAITRLVILFGLPVAQKVAGHSSSETTRIYDESGDTEIEMALLGQRKKMEDMRNQ